MCRWGNGGLVRKRDAVVVIRIVSLKWSTRAELFNKQMEKKLPASFVFKSGIDERYVWNTLDISAESAKK